MSDKELEKVDSLGLRDSGIESRKSGSGSFGGFDKSSFDDFDSGVGSRRGTYDDDDDDDYDDKEAKVDLNAFMDIPAGDDVEDEEGDEDEEEDDEDEEEEDEDGEYETEEEEGNELGPSDEIPANIETPSHQILADQREQNKRTLKQKKRELINEYLHDIRHFSSLRSRNLFLGLRIISSVEQKQAIIKKYVEREMEEQERLKEIERLKRMYYLESCAALSKGKKQNKFKFKSKLKHHRSKEKRQKQRTRFSEDFVKEETQGPTNTNTNSSSTEPELKSLLKKKFRFPEETVNVPDVSMKALSKEYEYNTELVQERKISPKDPIHPKDSICKRRKYIKERVGTRLRKFSLLRTRFFHDVLKTKTKKKKGRIDLGNLNIDKLRTRSTKYLRNGSDDDSLSNASSFSMDPSERSSKQATQRVTRRLTKSNQALHGLVYGSVGKIRKFRVTKEALSYSRSKARMALDHHKQEQKIRLASADPATYKDLHHFKFQFADPRLTAKQASVKHRDELLKLLRSRHIPITQLRWPMEVRGIDFEQKNPYGRVNLNYSRLSNHDRDLPHTAYRMLLTNLAFLRTKEQRLHREHRKNITQLEEERDQLKCGLQEMFGEIVEGVRIFGSLCGITHFEKKDARAMAEDFIKELRKFYDEFLMTLLIKLYKNIHSAEFALHKLYISEGKGEGAELHEFKDIMRCREKLKSEHKLIESSILRYQRHSSTVLHTVRRSGKRIHKAKENITKMDSELIRLRKAVRVMIDGVYHFQENLKMHHKAETLMKSEIGILSSPVLTEEYHKLQTQLEDTKMKRLDLQRKYNSKVRDMEKIMIQQPPSRFTRYKLRS